MRGRGRKEVNGKCSWVKSQHPCFQGAASVCADTAFISMFSGIMVEGRDKAVMTGVVGVDVTVTETKGH